MNPYTPPAAAVADPVVPPIPRPRLVNVALLLFGIALAIGITVIAIRHGQRYVGQILIAIAVTGGICVAIAVRRNWARWVFAVLTGLTWINLTRFLIVFRHLPSNTLMASTMAADVMELVGVILLFTGPSNRWFKQPRSVIH